CRLLVRKRRYCEKISSHGPSRQVSMRESEYAFRLRRPARKRGILLGQHRELDLTRHLEVVLHLHVFGMQFFAAPRQLSLRQPLLRNVPENALKSDNLSIRPFDRGF